MPKDKEHIKELRLAFMGSGLSPAEMVNQTELLINQLARPMMVFRLNLQNPRPGSELRLSDAMLEIDEAVMEYAKWRRDAER